MARIRILQAVSGNDFSWSVGDIVDLPGDEAAKWVDGYRAELVRGEKVETPETAAAPEKAARTRRKAAE